MGGTQGKVYINGRLVVTAACDAKALTSVDVCIVSVPGGPGVPTLLIKIAEAKDLEDGSRTVFINGKPVMLAGSHSKTSTGDEAGSLGGVISGTTNGICKAITFLKDVSIEGQRVVRNYDIVTMNDGNAIGSLLMSQGVAPKMTGQPPKQTQEKLVCEMCQGPHETPKSQNSSSSKPVSGNLRKHVLEANGWESWYHHPWCLDKPGSLQVHHLISCEALAASRWGEICRAFGYNLDEAYNGIALPAVRQLACAMAAPYHVGNHSQGWCYDSAGNMLDGEDEPVEDREGAIVYTDAVKRELAEHIDIME